jgi:hypothetical protein
MGEITKHDPFGAAIIDTVLKYKINTVLEIGSWDGSGSTTCFFEAMKQLDDPKSLTCLEVELSRYDILKHVTSKHPWIKCYNTSSITYDELVYKDFEQIWSSPFNGIPRNYEGGEHGKKMLVKSWFDQDIANLKRYDKGFLSEHKDEFYQGALIDGGEFNGYSEYLLLKDRVNFFFLDDYYHAFKTRQVAAELEQSGEWDVLVAEKDLRNGFCILKRKKLL